jgi:hypothetical protein
VKASTPSLDTFKVRWWPAAKAFKPSPSPSGTGRTRGLAKRRTRSGMRGRGRHRHWVDAFLLSFSLSLFLFLLLSLFFLFSFFFFRQRATPMSLNHVLQGRGWSIEFLRLLFKGNYKLDLIQAINKWYNKLGKQICRSARFGSLSIRCPSSEAPQPSDTALADSLSSSNLTPYLASLALAVAGSRWLTKDSRPSPRSSSSRGI